MRNLYHETEPVLIGGHTSLDQRRRIKVITDSLRQNLEGWTEQEREDYIAVHYDDYWLKTDEAHQLLHAALVRQAKKDNLPVATKVLSDSFTAITELMIYAQAHPRFLSHMAGACAAAGANIVSAQISTTRDGMALDNFYLQREFDREEDELRRGQRIVETINSLLHGEVDLQELLKRRSASRKSVEAFTIDPLVTLDNRLSDGFSVIEIEALDRPGLLYAITNALSELNLSITSAHISTYGEKLVDAFYVKDLLGEKILDENRWTTIKNRLVSAIKTV